MIKALYYSITSCFLLIFGMSEAMANGTYEATSGTGFYVTNYHIITNEHVVQNCQRIYIRSDKGLVRKIPMTEVSLVAVDKELDLAILKTRHAARRIANLRANNGIKKGDTVMVVGYPKDHSRTGKYHKAKGTIIKVEGTYGNERFVEFTDAVQQGNSGGPLLDPNGNIIGVIVGMRTYPRVSHDQPEKRTSVAISLAQLKKFLKRKNIFYRINNTFGKYPESKIESFGQHMIVNVQCIKK